MRTVKAQATGEELSRRFYVLNAVVAVVLLAAILVSINQFGAAAWHGRRQVALVIPGEKSQPGWNRAQYSAVRNACDELGYDMVLREGIGSEAEACGKVAEELSRRGINNVIFANGCLLKNIVELEKRYPHIAFSTIESISALNTSGRYSIMAFEASYLAGILAGLHSKSGKIGYIAPFVNPEINQGINAFTLGVKRVRPEAEVLLNWTGGWDNALSEEQAVQNLRAAGVDFLTYHQNGETVPNACARLGINFVAFNEVYANNPRCLAAIKINWNEAYMDLIKYKDTYEIKAEYAYGLNQGLVTFEVLGNLSKREQVLIDTATWELERGRWIFAGEIFDRAGVQRCGANEAISMKSLQENMNWLIRGVRVVGN